MQAVVKIYNVNNIYIKYLRYVFNCRVLFNTVVKTLEMFNETHDIVVLKIDKNYCISL